MNVFYISSSEIPSRKANTIHTISMCNALTSLGNQTTLFIRSDINDHNKILIDNFELETNLLSVVISMPMLKRGTEFFIAVKAFVKYLDLKKSEKKNLKVIARNIFAAFLFGIFLKKKIIYETHIPERKFLRKFIQKLLLKNNHITTIVISDALKKILMSHFKLSFTNVSVFRDGSSDDNITVSNKQKLINRKKYFSNYNENFNYDFYAGYFGHLYEGRGIEIIEQLAEKNMEVLFLVFGGQDEDINRYRKKNKQQNLIFMGHLKTKEVKSAMSLMDALLMPYQKSVSVSVDSIDTVKWMSPIKMFEYMSTGLPIISSKLPVLEEVLVDRHNSLLVDPEDVEEWSIALNELISNLDLGKRLGNTAYDEFTKNYTWKQRAESMLKSTFK